MIVPTDRGGHRTQANRNGRPTPRAGRDLNCRFCVVSAPTERGIAAGSQLTARADRGNRTNRTIRCGHYGGQCGPSPAFAWGCRRRGRRLHAWPDRRSICASRQCRTPTAPHTRPTHRGSDIPGIHSRTRARARRTVPGRPRRATGRAAPPHRQSPTAARLVRGHPGSHVGRCADVSRPAQPGPSSIVGSRSRRAPSIARHLYRQVLTDSRQPTE